MPNPFAAMVQQNVSGVGLAADRRLDGRDGILDGAGGSRPPCIVTGVRVARIVEIICCDRVSADVNIDPPEQRHAVEAGKDNPPPGRTGELRIGAKRQDRGALAQGGAGSVDGFGEVLVGHHPADVDVAVFVGGASTKRPAELGAGAGNPALQRR